MPLLTRARTLSVSPLTPRSRAANADGADLSQGQFGSFAYTGPVDDIIIFWTSKPGTSWDTAAPLQLRGSFRPASAVIKLDDSSWDRDPNYLATSVTRAMGARVPPWGGFGITSSKHGFAASRSLGRQFMDIRLKRWQTTALPRRPRAGLRP